MTQTHYHVALITALIMFVAVLVINTLANTLPINNQTTGQISNQYPNLFQPSGMTFSIWGLIYLSLGAWIVYQLFQWQMPINESSKSIIYVLHAFSVSSLFKNFFLAFQIRREANICFLIYVKLASFSGIFVFPV